MKIEMICKDCGEKGTVDKEKSNDNWVVYKTKCDKCGGNIMPKIK